jgi:hypothetical protein
MKRILVCTSVMVSAMGIQVQLQNTEGGSQAGEQLINDLS